MRIESIHDLPPHMRDIAAKQMFINNVAKKKPKYNSQRTEQSGITFDSKKEFQRYEELMLLLQSGEIRNLKLQDTFVLVRAYTKPEGEKVKAMTYRADFTYERDGKLVVEDVKGYKGGNAYQQFKNKKKLMHSVYGLNVEEI